MIGLKISAVKGVDKQPLPCYNKENEAKEVIKMVYVLSAIAATVCGVYAGISNYNWVAGAKKNKMFFAISCGLLIGFVSFLCFIS